MDNLNYAWLNICMFRRTRDSFKSLKYLLKNPYDTAQVFKMAAALDHEDRKRAIRKLNSTKIGKQIVDSRLNALDFLGDTAWLEKLPKGSVGHAYLNFLKSENLNTQKLYDFAAQEKEYTDFSSDTSEAWLYRHTFVIHDIWHVLTGYGTHPFGEACLMSFSSAQTGSKGFGLVALGGIMLSIKTPKRKFPHIKTIVQAYLIGKRASWLYLEDYQKLLEEPISLARKRLNIPETTLYTPFQKRVDSIKQKRKSNK